MQIFKSNKAKYEYDIHSLVKAFYPAWELKVLTPESVVKDRRILEILPVMELEFDETEVRFIIHSNAVNAAGETEGKGLEDADETHVYTWHDADQADLAEYKDAFKRFLYTSLREETGISLPWGNLTGMHNRI